jgi:hypothetical protein
MENSPLLEAETVDVPLELMVAAAQLPAKSHSPRPAQSATSIAQPTISQPIGNSQIPTSKSQSPKPQTFAASASRATFHAPIPEPPATTTPAAGGQSWNVAKAELLPSATGGSSGSASSSPGSLPIKQLISPWYYLQQPLAAEPRTGATAAEKKSFDWLKLPNWLQAR